MDNFMGNKFQEFVTKLPKSDLHVHLDGSVRIETLIELSKEKNLPLPSFTVEGLNDLVYKENYANLVEYLAGFGYVLPIMQFAGNIERISYEFAMDNINEGVCYVEVRFAPQLHTSGSLDIEDVLLSVDKGFKKAQREYNNRSAVRSGELLEFNYGIVVCAMRSFFKGMAKAFDILIKANEGLNYHFISAMAALELVKASVQVRDKHDIPIVALDLAGAEAGNPPIYYQEAYHFARQNFMHMLAHAGEDYGPESIFQAVIELGSERIGHGTSLFSPEKILDESVQDKDLYVRRLVQYLAERRITIEVCLSSNLQTLPVIGNVKNHPLTKMLAAYLSVAICTDNRTVSKTTVTKELCLVLENFGLSKEVLKSLIVGSFKHSFYSGPYVEKIAYVKKVAEKYDAMVEQYSEGTVC
jgi:adenosine deaminase